MLNPEELNAIAYALNYAIANQDDLEELSDTPSSHKLFMSYLERSRDHIEALQSGHTIGSYWSIEDVQGLRDEGTVTDEQAKEVLKRTKRRHDASIGINWDVLEFHLDDVLKGN